MQVLLCYFKSVIKLSDSSLFFEQKKSDSSWN